MKLFRVFIPVLLILMLLSACDLKINLNSNLNQSSVTVEPNSNQNTNADRNINAGPVAVFEYEVIATPERMVTEIKIGEVTINDLKALCGNEVMVYAEPKNGYIIFQVFNPGSDKPVSNLYSLDLNSKGCKKLEVSKELADFGARILSPNQTKLALALETNEAKEIKLLDLINDAAKFLVTLPEGET